MNMKRKISLVVLGLSSCAALILAETADPCAQKFNSCVDSAKNAFSQCKARGVAIDGCEKNQAMAKQECEKAKKKCEGEKAGNKATTPPKKADPKKAPATKTSTTTATDANKK